jgi:phage gp46-like protein
MKIDIPLSILTNPVQSKAENENLLRDITAHAFQNAIRISLFQEEKWWGETEGFTQAGSIGNTAKKMTDDLLDEVELLAVQNLQWLMDRELCDQITVTPEITPKGLQIGIDLAGHDGTEGQVHA